MSSFFIQFDFFPMFLFFLIFFFFYLFLENSFFKFSSNFLFFLKNFLKILNSSFFSMMSLAQKNLGLNSIFIVLFFFISLSNIFGLFSYIFSWMMNYILIFFFAFSFWLSFLLGGFLKNFIKNFSHLAPKGTPIYLGWFIVFIETLSTLIRPITLCVRLSTNISTGHLLLSLICSSLKISIFFGWSLFFLELMVSFVQAYVFSTLLVLYFSENY